MGDKIQRVTRNELEKRAAELSGEERFMTPNDQLVHMEVQGVIAEQHQQGLSVAKLQVTVDKLERLLDAVVIDRNELVGAIVSLRAECEQMHVHQNNTDARLDVLKAIFDSGLEVIRAARQVSEDTSRKMDEQLSNKIDGSVRLPAIIVDLDDPTKP